VLLAGLALPSLARAQDYPTRPIRMIVPFAPGGSADLAARTLAEPLAALLGQSVVVENRGGAGATLGAPMVAQAAPDGYTLLINGNGMAISKLLFRNPGFDWEKDFRYVARTATSPMLLVVNDQVPARTLQEFIAYARANPGKLNHGTPGSGTSQHLAGALFDDLAGTRIVHVPYRGTGPSVAGLVGNEVQAMFASITAVDGLIRDGRVRPLASCGPTRARAWPNLPSIAEALPGYSAELWYPLAVPAQTPDAVVRVLDQATNAVFTDPTFVKMLEDRGFDTSYMDSAGVTAAMQADNRLWSPITPRAGITPE